MMIGGILFIIGAALQAGAVHLAMLIVGRIMLGFGVRCRRRAMHGSPCTPDHVAAQRSFKFRHQDICGGRGRLFVGEDKQGKNQGVCRMRNRRWAWRTRACRCT